MNGQQARMYRLYFLDDFHRVESWQARHCTSDAEAFAEAAALLPMTEGRLLAAERSNAVPFFQSRHYETNIDYVGHAKQWD